MTCAGPIIVRRSERQIVCRFHDPRACFLFSLFFFFHTDKMYEPDATTSSDPDLKIGTDTKSVASTLSNHVQLPPVGTNDDHKAYVSHARLGGPNQTR